MLYARSESWSTGAVADADVIAVRAERDVLAAARRIAAREDGDDVARGERGLDEVDRAVDRGALVAGARAVEPACRRRSAAVALVTIIIWGVRAAAPVAAARRVDGRAGRCVSDRPAVSRSSPSERDAGGAHEAAVAAEEGDDGDAVRGIVRGHEQDEASVGLRGGDPGGGIGEDTAEDDAHAVEGARGAAPAEGKPVGRRGDPRGADASACSAAA